LQVITADESVIRQCRDFFCYINTEMKKRRS